MARKDYRTLFLKEFTKSLILNTPINKKDIFPHHPVREMRPSLTLQIPQPALHSIMIQPTPTHLVMPPQFPVQTLRLSQGKPLMNIPENPAISNITPVPSQLPQNFSLNKLDPLIRDNTVTVIECPGPGKPVIVKSIGRIVPSQVILSEQEIKNVVEIFSNFAKIPVIEGIFKAAVGNLLITAVLSDFVGSRFVINKYTPYSLIEAM